MDVPTLCTTWHDQNVKPQHTRIVCSSYFRGAVISCLKTCLRNLCFPKRALNQAKVFPSALNKFGLLKMNLHVSDFFLYITLLSVTFFSYWCFSEIHINTVQSTIVQLLCDALVYLGSCSECIDLWFDVLCFHIASI